VTSGVWGSLKEGTKEGSLRVDGLGERDEGSASELSVANLPRSWNPNPFSSSVFHVSKMLHGASGVY
jgi:hypothetical protein